MTQNVALIADIGGTHARFAIVNAHNEIAHTQILRGADYDTIADAYRAYVTSLPDDLRVTDAALAVAGPVVGDDVLVTNRGWRFSQKKLQSELQLETLHVINDFMAIALSLPHLHDTDKISICAGVPEKNAPCVVVGPGTGLGVAGLVPQTDGTWLPLPGEGGHVSLPATNEQEAAILSLLQKEFGYVSAERVLSGQGLVNLYRALAVYKKETPLHTTPQEIAAGFAAGESLARDATEQFCAFLGTVAGDAALTMGARGGVYLAGGILPQMIQTLQLSGFSSHFNAKGVVETYLKAVPVWLITHKLPAFIGLQFFLRQVKSG